MSCCCQSVPTLGCLKITISDTTATLVLDGTLPVSGRFNIRVIGCCLDKCSATPIALNDAAGTTITSCFDKCGNPVYLGKVAIQAARGQLLHFCRSTTTPTLCVLQDKICCPTPIVDTTTASASTPTTGSTDSTASGAVS